MGEILIKVNADRWRAQRLPIPLEVIETETHERLSEYAVLPGETATVRVKPGDYSITAFLPSGRSVRASAHVIKGESLKVSLRTDESTFDSELDVTHPAEKQLFRVVRWDEDCVCLQDGNRRQMKLIFWHSKGRNHFDRAPVPAPVKSAEHSVRWIQDAFCRLDMRLEPSSSPLWMMVTTETQMDQFIAVPPAKQINIAVGKTGSARDSLPRVVINGDNIYTEAMFAYLHHGSTIAARVLGPKLMRDRINKFSSRDTDYSAATVAGYFSLQWSDPSQQLKRWLKDFSQSTTSFPDSNIIFASYLMTQESVDFPLVRDLLLEAWQRGMPTYTEGLRRLARNLVYLNEIPGLANPELNEASHEVDRLSLFADPTAITTSIRCHGSNKLHSMLHFGHRKQ